MSKLFLLRIIIVLNEFYPIISYVISLRLIKSQIHTRMYVFILNKVKICFSAFYIKLEHTCKYVILMMMKVKKSKSRSPPHVMDFLLSVSLPLPGSLLTPTTCRTPPPPSRRVRSRACPVTPSRRTPCPSPIPLACKYMCTQTQTKVYIAQYSIFFSF